MVLKGGKKVEVYQSFYASGQKEFDVVYEGHEIMFHVKYFGDGRLVHVLRKDEVNGNVYVYDIGTENDHREKFSSLIRAHEKTLRAFEVKHSLRDFPKIEIPNK